MNSTMFRWLSIIGGLVGVGLIVVFVAMNTQVVLLNFFFWKIEASLALFLILGFALGWLVGFFIPKMRNRKNAE